MVVLHSYKRPDMFQVWIVNNQNHAILSARRLKSIWKEPLLALNTSNINIQGFLHKQKANERRVCNNVICFNTNKWDTMVHSPAKGKGTCQESPTSCSHYCPSSFDCRADVVPFPPGHNRSVYRFPVWCHLFLLKPKSTWLSGEDLLMPASRQGKTFWGLQVNLVVRGRPSEACKSSGEDLLRPAIQLGRQGKTFWGLQVVKERPSEACKSTWSSSRKL